MKVFNHHLLSILFVSVCTTSLGLTSFLLHGSKIWMESLSLIFFSTLFVYSFHRLIKILRYHGRNRIESGYTGIVLLGFLSAFALFFIIYIIEDVGPGVYLLFGIAGILTIWYTLDIPLGKYRFNLRSIPYLKIFLITAIWTIMTVSLPLVDTRLSGNYWIIFFERVFFILALSIPFDIRDMEGDRKEGIVTFPLAFGWIKMKRVSIYLMMGFMLISLYAFFIQMHTLKEFLALMAAGLTSSIVINKVNDKKSPNYYFYQLEGLSLVQCLLVYMSHL